MQVRNFDFEANKFCKNESTTQFSECWTFKHKSQTLYHCRDFLIFLIFEYEYVPWSLVYWFGQWDKDYKFERGNN